MSKIDAIELFNRMYGRLRVSVTHQCQLRCHFCHREGIADHWVSRSMAVRNFDALAQAYAQIGGKYLELTGGEPTLHPEIDQLLRLARASGCDVILCTNGLRLDRALAAAEAQCVQLVRLSLHHDGSDPEGARRLLGKGWSFDRIERNLNKLLELDVPVQLIFTHTGANEGQLDAVLRRAFAWGVDVQVVDLIPSRVADSSDELGYRTGEQAELIVSHYAQLEQTVTDRTGAILRRFKTPSGASWEVKDSHFGVLHSGMCARCSLRSKCGEGIYALRIDSLGVIKPCLLRSDLEEIMPIESTAGHQIEGILEGAIMRMLADPLDWNYGDAHTAHKIS
ncbi:MAG: cyclohydrolase subunit MoaA [Sphingomonas bacterium]|uniref:radical SAM protein n=1 Tax=Sphingomonas bacterium TaxID=1895847 RepID=UPI002620B699|nr:radical SAM protein [Sphingomonas bacterium]MDB5703278.1 cyclohydrolase subunit MoaA [Sphingomonas bacterium]